MKDEEEGFKVRDRRGRASDDDSPEARPSAAPPAPDRDVPAAAADTWPPADASEAGVLDLRAVLMMFASSALMGLGEAEDPVTGQRHVDLQQTQEAIDVLMLLREKTEGNRTEDESAFLDDVLYDLQVRFVRMTEGHQA